MHGFLQSHKDPYLLRNAYFLFNRTLTYKSSIKILLDQSEFICCTHDSKSTGHFQSDFFYFNPKTCKGGGCCGKTSGTYMKCILSIFVKTSQILFWCKLFDVSFHQTIFWLDDRNRLTERGYPFLSSDILAKQNRLPKAKEQKKNRRFVRSFTKKKIQKVLIKIEDMPDVFLNLANFAPHAFLTLAPPSGYALNLKVLIKVSKVS